MVTTITRKTKTIAPTRPHRMLTRWFPGSVLKRSIFLKVVLYICMELMVAFRTIPWVWIQINNRIWVFSIHVTFSFLRCSGDWPIQIRNLSAKTVMSTIWSNWYLHNPPPLTQIQILISTYFLAHQGLSNDWYYEHTVKLKSNFLSDFNETWQFSSASSVILGSVTTSDLPFKL